MQSMIGVTGSIYNTRSGVSGVFAGDDYTSALAEAGAMPFVIPNVIKDEQIIEIADRMDGLLLTGGADMDPAYFGEEPIRQLDEISPIRDEVESKLTAEFLQRDKPIFAICRGLQVLNVVAGGSLYQDLTAQKRNVLKHSQNAPRWHATHVITITPESILQEMLGAEQIRVNSFHHQAIRQVAPGFVVTAKAADGVIEAIESTSHRFVVGVQWHPENMWRNDPTFFNLFQTFVDHCVKK